MPTIHVFSGPTGVWVRTVQHPDRAMLNRTVNLLATETAVVVNTEDPAERNRGPRVYLNGGEITALPPQPGPNTVFNPTTRQWEDSRPIEEIRAVKHAAIEAERDRRIFDPVIVYNGVRLDATPGSKQNLQDKITATASRIAKGRPTPRQMLVWRDADNVIHAFPTLQEYKDWLDGFAIALEERGMQAWAWSWQMKDQLSKLTTRADVIAFNPTGNPV